MSSIIKVNKMLNNKTMKEYRAKQKRLARLSRLAETMEKKHGPGCPEYMIVMNRRLEMMFNP